MHVYVLIKVRRDVLHMETTKSIRVKTCEVAGDLDWSMSFLLFKVDNPACSPVSAENDNSLRRCKIKND